MIEAAAQMNPDRPRPHHRRGGSQHLPRRSGHPDYLPRKGHCTADRPGCHRLNDRTERNGDTDAADLSDWHWYGQPDTLTVGAQKIIARSDCLIGAKRMLQTVNHPTARQFSSFRNEGRLPNISHSSQRAAPSACCFPVTPALQRRQKLAGLLKSRFPDDRLGAAGGHQLAAIFLRQAANRLGRRQAFQRPRQAGAGRAAGAPPSAGVCADRQQPDCAGRLQTAVWSRDWVMRRCGSANSCPTRRSASFPAPPNSWQSRVLTRWRSC